MANVALLTRARSAIVAPDDLMTNAGAAARYHELHRGLEPLLAGAYEVAIAAFELVEGAVAEDPTIAEDEVTMYMVRSARQLVRALRDSKTEEQAPDLMASAYLPP
jgi:hypothetical protein